MLQRQVTVIVCRELLFDFIHYHSFYSIAKASCCKSTEIRDMVNGNTLVIGGKEIEVRMYCMLLRWILFYVIRQDLISLFSTLISCTYI